MLLFPVAKKKRSLNTFQEQFQSSPDVWSLETFPSTDSESSQSSIFSGRRKEVNLNNGMVSKQKHLKKNTKPKEYEITHVF